MSKSSPSIFLNNPRITIFYIVELITKNNERFKVFDTFEPLLYESYSYLDWVLDFAQGGTLRKDIFYVSCKLILKTVKITIE